MQEKSPKKVDLIEQLFSSREMPPLTCHHAPGPTTVSGDKFITTEFEVILGI